MYTTDLLTDCWLIAEYSETRETAKLDYTDQNYIHNVNKMLRRHLFFPHSFKTQCILSTYIANLWFKFVGNRLPRYDNGLPDKFYFLFHKTILQVGISVLSPLLFKFRLQSLTSCLNGSSAVNTVVSVLFSFFYEHQGTVIGHWWGLEHKQTMY